MGQVWTLNDWNNIIQQVNDLAQNPDQGCEPVSPLESVDPPHKWSKADIQQVQDKLKEICDENQFGDIPDKWKQSVVDEINDAIARGWCNCDECVPPCEDYGFVEQNIETIQATGCTANAPECQAMQFNWNTVKQQALTLGYQAGSASGHYDDYFVMYCSAQKQVDAWQEKVDAQQAVVDQVCSQQPPNPDACAAEQSKLAQYQGWLDYYTQQRDEYEQQMNQYNEQADSYAQQQAAVMAQCVETDCVNMWYLVTGLVHPWSDQDCEKLPPSWYGGGPSRCRGQWSLTWQNEGSQYWNHAASGWFTPNGVPYATWLLVPPLAGTTLVFCCGPGCHDPWPGNPCMEAEQRHSSSTWRMYATSDTSAGEECP